MKKGREKSNREGGGGEREDRGKTEKDRWV